MSELVCIAFKDSSTADRVLNELRAMESKYILDLEDAVIVIRDMDGKVHLKQCVDVFGGATQHGVALGMLWGGLIVLLFFNLLAGLLREDERKSLNGFPGAIRVPILRQLFSNNDQTIGQTDELGLNIVADPVDVHDLQATILHLLGMDHLRLTYRHMGRDFRLTDVHGNVVKKICA